MRELIAIVVLVGIPLVLICWLQWIMVACIVGMPLGIVYGYGLRRGRW